VGRNRKLGNTLPPGIYKHGRKYRVKPGDKWVSFYSVKEAEAYLANPHAPDSLHACVEEYAVYLDEYTENSPDTKRNKLYILRKYAKLTPSMPVGEINHVQLQKAWESTLGKSAHQNHRKVWLDFGKRLQARGLWGTNRTEQTQAIVAKREEARHTDEGYQMIYNAAPDWFQIAMELAVSSLQDAQVLAGITKADVVREEGVRRIRLTRHKTGANLAIVVPDGSRFAAAVDRGLEAKVFGQTLIRRKGANPVLLKGELGKEYRRLRELTGAYSDMKKAPSFRALRSYGGKLYRDAGFSEQYVKSLYAHANQKTTNYYTDDGYEPRYQDVEAGL